MPLLSKQRCCLWIKNSQTLALPSKDGSWIPRYLTYEGNLDIHDQLNFVKPNQRTRSPHLTQSMKPVLQVSILGPPVTSFTALTNVCICFAFSHIALQPKEAKDLFSWWALRWKSSLKYLPIRKITNINKYMWKAQDSVKSFCQSCQNQKQVNFHSGQLFQYVSKWVEMCQNECPNVNFIGIGPSGILQRVWLAQERKSPVDTQSVWSSGQLKSILEICLVTGWNWMWEVESWKQNGPLSPTGHLQLWRRW